MSIDTPIGGDDSNRTIKDIIPDDSISIEDRLDSKTLRHMIQQSLASLSKREEQVLRLRFGLDEVIDTEHIHEVE
jgi:RNA polymerase primary sigma factor